MIVAVCEEKAAAAERLRHICIPPSKCARYGLAADALIALGGLSAAVRDKDGGEARRELTLTKESLNDILTIAVNNNLNRTD